MVTIDIRTRLPLVQLPSEAEPELEDATPKDILAQCLESAATIESLVVMMKDTDGVIGFVSNLDGMAETNLFIDLVKLKALMTRVEAPAGGGNLA